MDVSIQSVSTWVWRNNNVSQTVKFFILVRSAIVLRTEIFLYKIQLNILLHIITFANATTKVKGMKDCFGSKTQGRCFPPTGIVVLTLFLGFMMPAQAQQSYKVDKVVLDAGHGGKDPGCHGHHTHEKEIALAITLELGRRIEAAFPDVEVIYTRKTDKFIALNERAAIANRNKADLFISIHCNYIGARNRATGTETYVMGLHRAEDNLDVAKRENASILLEEDFEKTYEGFDPYSPEGHIILSMFQNAHLQQSILLANYVESAFKKMTQLPSRGVKQAGFLVLRETTMPSVLIETGFLSTDADENYLMKTENQHRVAEAILKAFSSYKREVEDVITEIAETAKESEPVKTPVTVVAQTSKPTEQKTSGPKPDEKLPVPSKPAQTTPSPSEITYRVQVAASSKSTIDATYHNLPDLEVIKEDGLYKFVVGKFPTREAALACLTSIKEKGFQGAFITSYKGGQRIRA